MAGNRWSALITYVYFRVRRSNGRGILRSVLAAWRRDMAGRPRASLDRRERIVVIGVGIAALTLAKELRTRGAACVTLVSRDDLFGGTCVNFGCMPSEYFDVVRDLEPTARDAGVRQFVHDMRATTARAFSALGYEIKVDAGVAILGNELVLASGERLPFDRLVVATGRARCNDGALAGFPPLDLARLWEWSAGRLAIVTDHDVSALAMAALAADRGLQVEVLFAEDPAVLQLPSVAYFVQNLQRRGVVVHASAKELSYRNGVVSFRGPLGHRAETFDHVVSWRAGGARLAIPIDGKRWSVEAIGQGTLAVGDRVNVHALGDASGMMSATEAELQAVQLVRSWETGEPLDPAAIARLPARMHAREPLAMVGKPWTYAIGIWRSVDFKQLGWSSVHKHAGKLWYVFDPGSRRIQAIHICHRDAAQLVSMAAPLLDLPVDDLRWRAAAVHPSSAEILKVMIEQALAEEMHGSEARPVGTSTAALPKVASVPIDIVEVPPLAELYDNPFFQRWLTPQELRRGLLEVEPRKYFGLIAALKQLYSDARVTLPRSDASSSRRARVGRQLIEFQLEPTQLEPTSGREGLAVRANGRTVHLHFV